MTRILPFGLRRAGAPIAPGEAGELLAALRTRRLHRRRTRDRIPAYLVLGPPGMGKSMLIERSGLDRDPPLELASSNWWIGEEAFLVEVSQDPARDGSHPVFPLLRRLRPMVPVSGVILVLSPADLTLADATERGEMSAAVSRFLREFEGCFGYAPPLYVVVSKLDLTPGFAEFFDRLEPAEREQPWGFTLPVELGRRGPGTALVPALDPAAKAGPARGRDRPDEPGDERRRGPDAAEQRPANPVAEAYHAGFRRLLDAIRARVVQWISHETDPVECARIVGFGAQVAALEAILKPIVEPLIPADDRRWAGAYFRGIYLTSTQQDALSIDALLPDMAKRFRLPRSGTVPPDLERDDETLNYFVEGTFRRVILPEAGLAQQGHAGSRLAAIRGAVLSAAVVAACAGLGILAALSYQDGIARIAGVNAAVAAIGPTLSTSDPADLPGLLSGLDTLAVLRGPGAAAFPPPVISLDRYAQALIAADGGALHDQAVVNGLAPHLGYRLSRDLVRLDAPTEALRRALAAAASDGRDAGAAYRAWLDGQAPALPHEAQASLLLHGGEAFQLGAAPGVDPAYPAAARGILDSRGAAR